MKTVSYVIKLLKEFEDSNINKFEGVTRDEAIMLAILIIKDIPEYAGYKEEELRKFEIKNYETILTKYAQDLANKGQDVPENIKILVEDLEKNKPEFEESVKSQFDELKQTEALIDQINVVSAEPVYFNQKATEQIKKVAQENSQKLTNSISRKLQIEKNIPEDRANNIAESYTNYLKGSRENQVIATAFLEREIEIAQQIPSGGFYLAGPTIANYGLKEIAKDEPKLATALILSSQKVNDLQVLGMDRQIVKLYFDELKHIQESGGKIDWISKSVAAQGLLTQEQVQIINSAGTSMSYSTFNQAFAAPVQGSVFNKVIDNVGQQVFGKLAKNFIKNKIGGEAFKKATGSILGAAIPGVGGVLGNALLDLGLKVLLLARKIVLPIFIGIGALAGGALFGGVGVIGGGAIGAVAAGGISSGSISSGVATVTGGVVALGGAFAAAIVVPLLIAIVGIPVVVAFILFIINSGAYVVPPAGNIVLNNGPAGPGCPSGWPVSPEGRETKLVIVQGPHGGETHTLLEAIDVFGPPGTFLAIGHVVRATHSGTVRAVISGDNNDIDDSYGRLIEIDGNCNGTPFTSWYAHLSAVEVTVGQSISFGQEIGRSGNSGFSTDKTTGVISGENPHLHYEFRPSPKEVVTLPPGSLHYPNKPPFMAPPYLPKLVPTGCSNYLKNSCGVSIP